MLLAIVMLSPFFVYVRGGVVTLFILDRLRSSSQFDFY